MTILLLRPILWDADERGITRIFFFFVDTILRHALQPRSGQGP